MTSTEPNPPRWAEALLRSLLRPADRESITGDLLEEYRAASRPSLGTLRANIWYIRHVLSMLRPLIQPFVFVLVGVNVLRVLFGAFGPGVIGNEAPSVLELTTKAFWYGSFVQASVDS